MEIDCIFRKKEEAIDQIDYLHIVESDKSQINLHHNSNEEMKSDDSADQPQLLTSKNLSKRRSDSDDNFFDEREEQGVYDDMTPVVGYTSVSNTCALKIYSLKCDRTLHVFRFNSPVVKFQTNTNSISNQLIILLQEGLLKIFNLATLEQEISLKTYNFTPKKGLSGNISLGREQ